MPNEMKHIPVAYPTVEEGLDSAAHLGKAALGIEDMARNVMIAHGWVAAGTGLGQVFPPNTVEGSKVEFTAEEKAVLEQFASMKAEDVGKVNWLSLLKIILPLILKLLGCVLVFAVFVGTSYAGEQAPRPPQAPEVPQVAVAEYKPVSTYRADYDRALRENKPWIVWVGGNFCERCVQESKDEFVHTFRDQWEGNDGPATVIAVPVGDRMHHIATISEWVENDPTWGHIPSARRAIRNFKAGLPTVRRGWSANYDQPPQRAAPMQMMRAVAAPMMRMSRGGGCST